jgi:short-subunit dehydrogenase
MTDSQSDLRPLAVVTGASSGIGWHLARICADEGWDLVVVADEPQIEEAAQAFRSAGGAVTAVQADLATQDGVRQLVERVRGLGRPVDALLANAGRGLGGSFLEQDFDEIVRVVNTNVVGTLALTHALARDMVERGRGRILFTGSIAGFLPGSFQAVYNGTKAFVDSFSFALRNELKDTGVSVTCLMPGATDTEFFERAGMENTPVGEMKKDDPADVARTGFDAMMRGDGDVVHGLKNKIQVAAAAVLPQTLLAEMHRKQAEPKE